MKNIAIITISLFKIGGTERAVSNLANILSQTYNVFIFSLYEGNKPFYELDERVKVVKLNMDSIPDSFFKKIRWYGSYIPALRNKLIEYKINYAISTTHALNTMLPLSVFCLGIKTIGCEHVVYNSVPFVYSLLRRLMYPKLNAIVVLTKFAQRKFHSNKNVILIPNSYSFVADVPSSLKNNQALAIGRFDYGKGFDDLIRIASAVKKKQCNVTFKIIGEGERKDEFIRLIKELDVEDRVFLFPPTKKIQEEYLNSSLYVMTSHSEALPMVLLEAKACGLPVISFACAEGPLDLIENGIDGYLIENRNIDMFADKVVKVIADNELRNNLGRNSFKSIEQYKPEKIEKLWLDLFLLLDS